MNIKEKMQGSSSKLMSDCEDKCILHEQFASTSIMDQEQIVEAQTLELKCKGCENRSFTSLDGSLYCICCCLQYDEDDFVFTGVSGRYGGARLLRRDTPATIMAEPLAWSQPDLELWSSVKALDDDVSVCMKRDDGEAGDGISQNPRLKVIDTCFSSQDEAQAEKAT